VDACGYYEDTMRILCGYMWITINMSSVLHIL